MREEEDNIAITIVVALGLISIIVIGLIIYALCLSYIVPPITYLGEWYE